MARASTIPYKWACRARLDIARIGEDGDDDGNFSLSDEIIEDVEGGVIAVTIGIAEAILKDHHGGWFFEDRTGQGRKSNNR